MHEWKVSGNIRTVGSREGSSGVFEGDIVGLYQGYRLGSTEPHVSRQTIQAPHGELVVELRQEIYSILPSRPEVHPFSDGQDPFADPEGYAEKAFAGTMFGPGQEGGPPGEGPPGGGPPGGGPPGGGPPGGGPPGGGPPGGGPPGGGPPGGGPPGDGPPDDDDHPFEQFHRMVVKVHALPDSTGIFAGATGETEIEVPKYKYPGFLIVETEQGNLQLDFLEGREGEYLNATLWVDGENSTGIYAGASGELTFSLETRPPLFGEGPYDGTISLQQAPPS
jgi:hypothetical protein